MSRVDERTIAGVVTRKETPTPVQDRQVGVSLSGVQMTLVLATNGGMSDRLRKVDKVFCSFQISIRSNHFLFWSFTLVLLQAFSFVYSSCEPFFHLILILHSIFSPTPFTGTYCSSNMP